MTPHEKIKKLNLLPENPSQFDYLHAIRAVACREGDIEVIRTLADMGMNPPPPQDDFDRALFNLRNGKLEDY